MRPGSSVLPYRERLTEYEFDEITTLFGKLWGSARGNPLDLDLDIEIWLLENEITAAELLSRFNLAHAIALRVYTKEAFPLVNVALRYDGFWRWQAIKTQVNRLIDQYLRRGDDLPPVLERLPGVRQVIENQALSDDEKYLGIYRIVEDSLPEIKEEVVAHAEMVKKALDALPPVKGTVWRGDRSAKFKLAGLFLRDYGGSRVAFSDLASFSRDRDTAAIFSAKETVGSSLVKPVVVRADLAGNHGRDISLFSNAKDEREVALTSGASLDVLARGLVGNGTEEILAVEPDPSGSSPARGTGIQPFKPVYVREGEGQVVFPPPGVSVDMARASAAQLPKFPGVLTVAARLTDDGRAVLLWNGDTVGFKSFAELVRTQLGDCMNSILLAACFGGALAEFLSRALGVEVIAAPEAVWEAYDGRLIAGEVRIFDNGEMVPSGPRNRVDTSQWTLYADGAKVQSLNTGSASQAVVLAGFITPNDLRVSARSSGGQRLSEPIHWGPDDSRGVPVPESGDRSTGAEVETTSSPRSGSRCGQRPDGRSTMRTMTTTGAGPRTSRDERE